MSIPSIETLCCKLASLNGEFILLFSDTQKMPFLDYNEYCCKTGFFPQAHMDSIRTDNPWQERVKVLVTPRYVISTLLHFRFDCISPNWKSDASIKMKCYRLKFEPQTKLWGTRSSHASVSSPKIESTPTSINFKWRRLEAESMHQKGTFWLRGVACETFIKCFAILGTDESCLESNYD